MLLFRRAATSLISYPAIVSCRISTAQPIRPRPYPSRPSRLDVHCRTSRATRPPNRSVELDSRAILYYSELKLCSTMCCGVSKSARESGHFCRSLRCLVAPHWLAQQASADVSTHATRENVMQLHLKLSRSPDLHTRLKIIYFYQIDIKR